MANLRREISCLECQADISALADGEDPERPKGDLEAHLTQCAGCSKFDSALKDRGARMVSAHSPPTPASARSIAQAVARADRYRVHPIIRGLLLVTAISVAILAVPSLISAESHHGFSHDARHLGAFSIAYSVGLLAVAVRPARALSMLPVALVLAGALVVTAIIDVIDGMAPFAGELTHLPEVISVGLIFLLARPRLAGGGPTPRRGANEDPTVQPLKAVDNP